MWVTNYTICVNVSRFTIPHFLRLTGVGDTFTIAISITDAVDLTSWQFDLGFNPAIVQANSVTGSISLAGGTREIPSTPSGLNRTWRKTS